MEMLYREAMLSHTSKYKDKIMKQNQRPNLVGSVLDMPHKFKYRGRLKPESPRFENSDPYCYPHE